MHKLLFFLLVTSLFAAGQNPAATTPASTKQDKPLQALPYSPSFDVTSMDKSIDPCVDLYTYSCGGWMKNNPIPADQSSWSVYGKLYNDNQQFLWGILDDLAKQTTGRNANQQKIGDYFAACMNESAVEKLGITPLQPQLDAISALKTKQDLAPLLAKEQMENRTEGLLFNFGSNQDFANSNDVIAFADDGGLGLPDRDYYVKTDPKSAEQRKQYIEHVTNMFQLLGDSPVIAQTEAAKVMEIETELAKATLTLVDKRDPYKLFHKMDRAKLQALTPHFDWNVYLKTIGLPNVQVFNVTEPDFYKEVNNLIDTVSLDDWKTYLRWHVVHANAPYLSSKFVNENFNF
ncbi:MAG TPA: M13 family metallopeptidase N-terminal domain-containing protein [Terriglobales bacterium]|nr:M13 family metallopeptidase N-terminal domain-containing protein [Terriglobales bacterium]